MLERYKGDLFPRLYSTFQSHQSNASYDDATRHVGLCCQTCPDRIVHLAIFQAEMGEIWFLDTAKDLLAAASQSIETVMLLDRCENRLVIARTCLRRVDVESQLASDSLAAGFDVGNDGIDGSVQIDRMV